MRVLLIFLVIAIAGCAGNAPAPEVDLYLLRSASTPLPGPASVSLSTVDVATYIDRPGLVLETSDGVMRPAVYHQWAEPLRESLRGYLGTELSRQLNAPVRFQDLGDSSWKQQPLTTVYVHVDELHGTRNGAARLVAFWRVAGAEVPADERRFEREVRLASSGYASLVDAHKALLDALAQSIAESF